MSKKLKINSTVDMVKLADYLGVRNDWHEPDEQEVTAEVTGTSFDNAGFGSEMTLIIKQDGKPVAEVNLATLCAMAARVPTIPDDVVDYALAGIAHARAACMVDHATGVRRIDDFEDMEDAACYPSANQAEFYIEILYGTPSATINLSREHLSDADKREWYEKLQDTFEGNSW